MAKGKPEKERFTIYLEGDEGLALRLESALSHKSISKIVSESIAHIVNDPDIIEAIESHKKKKK